jgi:GNAT superfamily N-acetyltransferase
METIYSRETLAQVRAAGVEQLLEAHYQEIAHFRDIPLAVDWEAYANVEGAGHLRIFTARIAGELVGYCAYFVNHNPHYKSSIQAVQDVLYLAPEHRGRTLGWRLIAYADEALAAEGVQAAYQHVKAAHPMDALLKRLGYELVDTIWAKRLDRS